MLPSTRCEAWRRRPSTALRRDELSSTSAPAVLACTSPETARARREAALCSRLNSAVNSGAVVAGGDRGIDGGGDAAPVAAGGVRRQARREVEGVEDQRDVVRIIFDARPRGAETAGDRKVAERAVDAAGRAEHDIARADRVAAAGRDRLQRAGEGRAAGDVGAVGGGRRGLDDVVARAHEVRLPLW